MLVVADFLETQSADRTGWFTQREPGTASEVVEIEDMYEYLADVAPAETLADASAGPLPRLFPPSVRTVLRAHAVVRAWVTFHLVDCDIDHPTRQKRMELILRAIEICRTRAVPMAEDVDAISHPIPISFVESALVSAVLSSPSRLFQRAWHDVASVRRARLESLQSLLSRRVVAQEDAEGDPLTMDMGWLLERMLELLSMPNTNLLESGFEVINLEKRRCVILFLQRYFGLTYGRLLAEVASALISSIPAHPAGAEGERLDDMLRSTGDFDFAGLKRAAIGDSHPNSSSAKKNTRPFQAVM